MAEIDKETVKNLTKLSRIDCTEAEQEALLHDLKRIISHMDQLNEVDTEHLKPCNHVLEDMVNVTREDKVGTTLPREAVLDLAPSQVGGLFRVPTVIKQS
jgi:aspartyl-tRNA(Asn)/glutamyl-tRNA(Gln) amidotransferase subunit C